MSAPRSIRFAIEACRPRRTPLQPHRLLPLRRSYSSSRPLGAESNNTTSREPQTPPAPSSRSDAPSRESNLPPQASTPQSLSLTSSPPESSTPTPPHQPPRNVTASYLAPLRLPAKYGVSVASLQLRSYSVRNVEFMADFAMRAAYYLGLPASGPVPLPRKIERWTVPRSNFVHKKSQENFERRTLRRLVTVMDGDAEVVQVWLAYLRKWQFWGVGMKANVWEYESVDVGKNMDKGFAEVERELDQKLGLFGWNRSVRSKHSINEAMQQMGINEGVPMTYLREASRTRQSSI